LIDVDRENDLSGLVDSYLHPDDRRVCLWSGHVSGMNHGRDRGIVSVRVVKLE
jgi:hypothetical protein